MTMANVPCLWEKGVERYLEDLAHEAHKAKGQGEGDGVSPIVGGAGGEGTHQELSVSDIFSMNN